jgi:hypothetical protein
MKTRAGSVIPPPLENRATPISPLGVTDIPSLSSESNAPESEIVLRRTPSPVVPAPTPVAPLPPSPAVVSSERFEPEASEAKGKGQQLWVVGAVVAVFIGGVAISLLRHRSSDTGSTSGLATSGLRVGQSASATAGSTVLVPTPTQVSVRVSVDPPNAELRLDGSLLSGNPFTSVFPKGDAIHELSASADGFKTEKRVLQFLKDVDLEVSLQRKGSGHASAVAAPVAPRAAVAPIAPARPTNEGRPSAPGVEPGMDLHSPPESRPKHTIDEKDPYGQ